MMLFMWRIDSVIFILLSVVVWCVRSVSLYGYEWVLSDADTSHSAACHHHGLHPTSPLDVIPWNYTIMSEVVDALGAVLEALPYGINGCCSPSLWCDDGICFTQSLSSRYVNHGPMEGYTYDVVYTCVTDAADEVKVSEVSASNNNVITVTGSKFGTNANDISITAATMQCNDIDICTSVCLSCESTPCPADSMCLMLDKRKTCLKHCAGEDDKSCPCDNKCIYVNVYTQDGYVPAHFCAPPNLDCANYVRNGEIVQCSAPTLHYLYVNTSDTLPVAIAVQHDAAERDMKSKENLKCESDADCFDSNALSLNTCDTLSKICSSTSFDGITQYPVTAHTKFTYLSYHTTVSPTFLISLLQNASVSSISNEDDAPTEVHDLLFDFVYFGNRVRQVNLNPNGLVTLPPFKPCHSLAGNLECIVHGTFTNAISLWKSDWDLTLGKDSKVYYASSKNAFHVLYNNVYKFISQNRKNPQNPNTFSASLYADGSVSLRYHTLTEEIRAAEVFGLWGSRASQEHASSVYYHEDNIDAELIVDGSEVDFCYLRRLGCVVNSCVYSGGALTIQLEEIPSCQAVGSLKTYCVWDSNEVVRTEANFASYENGTWMTCSVPPLGYANGTLISVHVAFDALNHSPINMMRVGDKDVYTMIENENGEVAPSTIMLRYYLQPVESCGCDVMRTDVRCSSCLVCGGNTSKVTDCGGECFGTAYYDSCHDCTGGNTGVAPDDSCDFVGKSPWQGDLMDAVSKTILLLTMMICTTFIFSACLRVVRNLFRFEVSRENGQVVFGLQPVNPVGLTRFEIEALGCLAFDGNICSIHHVINLNRECPICLTEFHEGEECRQLPCEHLFHKECIDRWFAVSVTCPMCKRNIRRILSGEEERPSSSSRSSSTDSNRSENNPMIEMTQLTASRENGEALYGIVAVSDDEESRHY